MGLARKDPLLFCRTLDGIVDIGDGEPLISLPRLAHVPNAGKGNVRSSHKVSLFCGFCKKTLPLSDGSLRVKVVLNGRIRQGKLRLSNMNGISPEQQFFTFAFKQVTGVTRSVPRCGHGVYSGQHHLARFKPCYLICTEVGDHALSDPVRVQILKEIIRSNSPKMCSDFLNMPDRAIPKSTLSQHFRILREAGLIRSERSGVALKNTPRCQELQPRFGRMIAEILAAYAEEYGRKDADE